MPDFDPALHRNGNTSPFGKLDDRVESFRIEGAVKERFAQVAAEVGVPANEFLREVMRVIAFGPDVVKRVHEERTDRVVALLAGAMKPKEDAWRE